MRTLSKVGPSTAILLLAIILFPIPAHAIAIGNNVDLIPAPDRQQAEPTVAVDPQNPSIIVAGAQDYNFAGLRHHRWHAIYRSVDGGRTWTNNLLPGFPGDTSPQGANSPLKAFDLTSDPVMAFDNHGNLYYAGIALNLSTFAAADFVAKYTNDGATYAGVALIPGFGDFPKIAVDRTGGPLDGNIYLTFFGGFSVSTDGGNTFSTPINLPTLKGPDHSVFCCSATGVTVGPSGIVLITGEGIHSDPKTGQVIPFLAVARVNETARGNLDDMVTTTIAVEPISELPSTFPGNQFRAFTLPEIAADNRGVYVVWSDNRTGDADVLFARSTDGGSTWSSPLRVNDVALGQQFFPTIVASGGIVSIAWYDDRLSTNPNGTIDALDVFYAQSTNAGQSFSPNVRVTSVSFNPNQAKIIDFNRGGPFIGDYISIAAGPGFVQPVWSDDRNACDFIDPNLGCVDEDIFTATITV